eukprot:jgi/Astpho2/9624/Aster-03895
MPAREQLSGAFLMGSMRNSSEVRGCTGLMRQLVPAGYFSQFGLVTKVRVSRNKKTGNSKHYAFVQFASPEVAAIAAEAMDGHMMFTCKLRARVLKAADVHPDLFKVCCATPLHDCHTWPLHTRWLSLDVQGSHRKFAKVPWQRIQADSHNRQRTAEEEDMRLRRLVEKDKKRAKRIKALGIDYEYEPLDAQLPPKPQHLTFEEEL